MSGEDEFKPLRREDVTDLALLPGEMRAFRVEMRDEIRSIASTLQALVRIEERLDVVIDRQNTTDKRLDAIEREQSRTDARLIALEYAAKRRKKVK